MKWFTFFGEQPKTYVIIKKRTELPVGFLYSEVIDRNATPECCVEMYRAMDERKRSEYYVIEERMYDEHRELFKDMLDGEYDADALLATIGAYRLEVFAEKMTEKKP